MHLTKTTILFFTTYCLSQILSCSSQTASHDAVAELIDTDKEFSNLSSSNGMPHAFIQFAAPDVIKLNINQHPVIGKENLIKALGSIDPDDFTLTWEPLKAEVEGSLGYTFGNYTLRVKSDTTIYGNYVSIWRKQSDNKWKFVLDAGNPTPGPTVYDKSLTK